MGCAQGSSSADGKSGPDTVSIKLTGTDQAAKILLLLCFYVFRLEVCPQYFFFAVLGRSQPHLDDFEHARYYTSQPSPLRQVPKTEHSPKGRIKPMVWVIVVCFPQPPSGQDVWKRCSLREEEWMLLPQQTGDAVQVVLAEHVAGWETKKLNWFALSLSKCSLLVLCDLLMMNDCKSRQQMKEK